MRKKFTKKNEGFTCEACSRVVPPHPNSSRDHCCYCLVGKHVDLDTPGDRESTCGALMEIESFTGSLSSRQGLLLTYRCKQCGTIHRNHTAPDDNMDAVVALLNKPRLK